jgi:small GTP-binding protein
MQVSGPAFRGRVVVIGDSSVGKTSILSRLLEDRFDHNEGATIGANYQLWMDEIASVKVELQIWDTAGQEKYRSLGPIYFRGAIGAVIIYDVTNRESFNHLEDWITGFSEVAETGALIVVAGNKCDATEHVVGRAEAREWAIARGIDWYQTSAKTGEGITELFRKFAGALLQHWAGKGTPMPGDLAQAPPNDGCSC